MQVKKLINNHFGLLCVCAIGHANVLNQPDYVGAKIQVLDEPNPTADCLHICTAYF